METKANPYYSRYDDHYNALYAQGIKYWPDGPESGWRIELVRRAPPVRRYRDRDFGEAMVGSKGHYDKARAPVLREG